jgi:hypothetical protein
MTLFGIDDKNPQKRTRILDFLDKEEVKKIVEQFEVLGVFVNKIKECEEKVRSKFQREPSPVPSSSTQEPAQKKSKTVS